MRNRRLQWAFVLVSVTQLGLICPDDVTKPKVATQLAIVSTPSASANNREALPNQPAVQLRDADGNAFAAAGVAVTVSISSGGGTLGGTTTMSTNASGMASFTDLAINGTVGDRILTFAASGLTSATAPVTLTPGAAATMAVTAGASQSGTAGAAVTTAPEVKVADADANAVGGVAVTFAVASGGGSLIGGSATTNAAGMAKVTSWTLGATAGANTLTATSAGLTGSPLTFSATGTAGAASTVAVSAGNNQTATAGSAISSKPAVMAADANGNAVAGVSITFSVASGGGSITGASQNTGSDGIATVGSWTLGTIAGANTLTATSTGLSGSPITFAATGTVGPAATLAKVAGDAQSASVSTAVAIAPSVKLTDANGNAVAAATVTFAVASGGGNVSSGSQTTNASGVATVGTWTLGSAAGANTLTASSNGVTSVTFSATAIGVAPTIVRFCSNMPIWFAYKNGTSGAWTQLTSNGDATYSVPLTSVGGIAWVMQDGSKYGQNIVYATRMEFAGISCLQEDVNGTKTINGSIAGANSSQSTSINLGLSRASVDGSSSFSLNQVADGEHDLVAGRFTLGSGNYLPTRYIVRRAINPANNSTLPVLDFAGAEAIPPSFGTYTLSGIGTDSWLATSEIFTANMTNALIVYVAGTGTGGDVAAPYRGLPVSLRVGTDRYNFLAHATAGESERGVTQDFTSFGDRAITLGPALTVPTITTVATSPNVLMRTQLVSQPEYSAYVMARFWEGGTNRRDVFLYMTSGYLGGTPSTWDLTMPDLSSAGFQAQWGLYPDNLSRYVEAGSNALVGNGNETPNVYAARLVDPGPMPARVGQTVQALGRPLSARLPFRRK